MFFSSATIKDFSLKGAVSLLGLAILILAASCATSTEIMIDELSPIEYFQQAQKEANQENWDLAIKYYQAFIENFPEDRGRIVEAEYEIAFVYYKKGDHPRAVEGFEALLEKYRSDEAATYPQWPRVLADQLLEKMASPEN